MLSGCTTITVTVIAIACFQKMTDFIFCIFSFSPVEYEYLYLVLFAPYKWLFHFFLQALTSYCYTNHNHYRNNTKHSLIRSRRGKKMNGIFFFTGQTRIILFYSRSRTIYSNFFHANNCFCQKEHSSLVSPHAVSSGFTKLLKFVSF